LARAQELQSDVAHMNRVATMRRISASIAHDRIFGAFDTTKASGLGMGLSISRAIIEAHGGRLWATNAPQGALFQLTLPAWPESK
jgi:signal transduction histidine kinase